MQQKLALAQRINVENIALLVGADVHAFDEGFVVLDENIGILEIGVAGAHGFDFGAFEGDAGFQCFKDEIIMPCFSVFCYYFLTHGVSSSSCLMISCWRMVSERRCERRFSACARWR